MKTKSNERRQLILDSAYQLFRSNGFEKTSMSDVNALAGVSKATVYNYFPSKEALFIECMIDMAESYLEGTLSDLSDPKTPLPIALKRFGESLLRLVCSPEMLAARRLMIAEAGRLGVGKIFHERITAKQERVASFLSDAMATGKLREAPPLVAAAQLRALLEAEILEWLLLCSDEAPPSDQAIEESAVHAIDTFLRAYAK